MFVTCTKSFVTKNINFVSCICKKFNNKGIPCKHILALLKKLQVTLLSDAYILKRWAKIAKLEKVVDDDAIVGIATKYREANG